MNVVHFFGALTTGELGILGGIILFVIWATRIHMKVGEISNLQRTVSQIDAKLNHLIGWLKAKGDNPFESLSPIQLSDYGYKILKKSGGSKIVDAYQSKVNLTDGMNEYEIQEACVNFALSKLESILKPDELAKVQKTAFSEGVPIGIVFHVIGLELRNTVFKQRNLTLDKIDQNDPKAGE